MNLWPELAFHQTSRVHALEGQRSKHRKITLCAAWSATRRRRQERGSGQRRWPQPSRPHPPALPLPGSALSPPQSPLRPTMPPQPPGTGASHTDLRRCLPGPNTKLVGIIHVHTCDYIRSEYKQLNSSSQGSGAQFGTTGREEKERAYLVWWVPITGNGPEEDMGSSAQGGGGT